MTIVLAHTFAINKLDLCYYNKQEAVLETNKLRQVSLILQLLPKQAHDKRGIAESPYICGIHRA